jgi:hypothetical protein
MGNQHTHTHPLRNVSTLQFILKTVNVKVKFTPEQATKGQRGSRNIGLLFL